MKAAKTKLAEARQSTGSAGTRMNIKTHRVNLGSHTRPFSLSPSPGNDPFHYINLSHSVQQHLKSLEEPCDSIIWLQNITSSFHRNERGSTSITVSFLIYVPPSDVDNMSWLCAVLFRESDVWIKAKRSWGDKNPGPLQTQFTPVYMPLHTKAWGVSKSIDVHM